MSERVLRDGLPIVVVIDVPAMMTAVLAVAMLVACAYMFRRPHALHPHTALVVVAQSESAYDRATQMAAKRSVSAMVAKIPIVYVVARPGRACRLHCTAIGQRTQRRLEEWANGLVREFPAAFAPPLKLKTLDAALRFTLDRATCRDLHPIRRAHRNALKWRRTGMP